MGIEIERKFLVIGDTWRKLAKPQLYSQGYLNSEKTKTVRVRIVGDAGWLTVKGLSTGAARTEFEYSIPLQDAQQMMLLCEQPLIEKNRYKILVDDVVWEVDEFHGVNEGLIIAEVELQSEDQAFTLPKWIGEEVTGDAKYFNSSLVNRPYSTW